MAYIYYAELIDGTDKWQIVCEGLVTGHRSIVGHNLPQKYAKELVEELQASDTASEHCTSDP
jgi:hypothetical protein